MSAPINFLIIGVLGSSHIYIYIYHTNSPETQSSQSADALLYYIYREMAGLLFQLMYHMNISVSSFSMNSMPVNSSWPSTVPQDISLKRNVARITQKENYRATLAPFPLNQTLPGFLENRPAYWHSVSKIRPCTYDPELEHPIHQEQLA